MFIYTYIYSYVINFLPGTSDARVLLLLTCIYIYERRTERKSKRKNEKARESEKASEKAKDRERKRMSEWDSTLCSGFVSSYTFHLYITRYLIIGQQNGLIAFSEFVN